MRFITLLLVVLPFWGVAQKTKPANTLKRPLAPCSLPGMKPESAIPVCGTTTFRQDNVTSCEGPEISGNGACGGGNASDNAFWYKFRCYQAGTLGFLLRPFSLNDDYDWEIFDVTNVVNVNEIYTNESLMVSLNLCGDPNGVTGCSPAGTDSINCGGQTFLFNRLATLKAGHDYLLMVNNWSNSGLGYTLSFVGGTANITENNPPAITDVAATCNTAQIKVTFSKDVLCNSVTPSGSEFTITPGANTITTVSSNCTLGFNSSTDLIINLQNPLPPGNYTLQVDNGTDGNTFTDACGSQMPTGIQIPFTVAAVNAVAVDTIQFTGCAPHFLDIKLTRPVWCSSVTATGSEFSILPGNPAITSVQTICTGNNPVAGILRIDLQNPLPHGSYQLIINNGTDGNTFIDTCNTALATGTVIPFVIPQTTTAPVIQSISFNECYPDKVIVNFDKPVSCSSLSANANEFIVNPGARPITAVNYTCTANNTITQATIILQNPLPAGNFTVTVANGTDGNTLSDSCFAFIPNGYNKNFVATQAPAPKFDSLQFDRCNPSFVKVFYNHPIKCSSVSADGSDYFITGPSAVNITAATTDITCIRGYTKWVLLQFAQPVNTFGNYWVNNKIGADGNGIIDTCSAVQNITETILFNALIKPSAVFTSQVKFGCKTDTVVLTHPGGNGINSWIWKFADGSTATGQTISRAFPVSTATVNIQLIVSNGFCSDSVSNIITLDNAFKAAFTQNPADTTCINTPVNFTDTSIGKNLQYLWNFGDNTSFSGKNPPAHIFTSNKLFTTQLIVTDIYGCKDTSSKILYVTALPAIDFTGLAPQYCTNSKVLLQKNSSNYIYTYTWNNGDSVTVSDKANVQFSYVKQGVYNITLTGTDKYCGTVQAGKAVTVFAVPEIYLGNDTVLCPAVQLQIGPAFNNAYTYLWSTGATTPQILTDIFTSNYSLVADNNGCKARDAISVKVLPACLIKVAGAFTPNADGVNDMLKAINADLATKFTLRVYNRSGQLMFSSTNPLDGWDGNYKGAKADAGAYVWQLSYTDPWSNKKVYEKGSSILIR